MAELNNQPNIRGVIFEKFVREVPDKNNKNNGEPFFFTTIVLETDNPTSKKKTFPQFDLGTKAGDGKNFNIGEEVEITYFLERDLQEWKDKATGEKVKKYVAKNKGMYIRKLADNTLTNVGSTTAEEFRSKARAEANKDTIADKPLNEDDDLPF
jgi:hypothetical protein